MTRPANGFCGAHVESPDDPVILHALQLVAARGISPERILLTRPLWEDGDLDHTAPGTPERALRMARVELDPDGYADALIALNATGLELDDESFLRMEVELSGHAVPFVFEMNHAGLSKTDPALARPSCRIGLRRARACEGRSRAPRRSPRKTRQERAPRAHQARARHDAALRDRLFL